VVLLAVTPRYTATAQDAPQAALMPSVSGAAAQ